MVVKEMGPAKVEQPLLLGHSCSLPNLTAKTSPPFRRSASFSSGYSSFSSVHAPNSKPSASGMPCTKLQDSGNNSTNHLNVSRTAIPNPRGEASTISNLTHHSEEVIAGAQEDTLQEAIIEEAASNTVSVREKEIGVVKPRP